MSALLLIVAGSFGLLGMTWLFPMLAQLGKFARLQSEREGDGSCEPGPPKAIHISILIPVHNEAQRLAATLKSIQDSIRHASEHGILIDARIRVAADGCTDRSAEVARGLGAEVHQLQIRQGKWSAIQMLTSRSIHSEWVVLVDAGTLWPENFFPHILPHLRSQSTMGISPSYQNAMQGKLERFSWWLEKNLKALESQAGGPVSVHGATVAYRTHDLLMAFSALDGKAWLNDDVVIPLTMRGLHPRKRIVYVNSLQVREAPAFERRPEFNRRRRMVLGNIQWMKFLWWRLWSSNRTAAVLALRRAFRVFWVYWIGLFMLGITGTALLGVIEFYELMLIGAFLTGVLVVMAVLDKRKSGGPLVGIIAASLLAPWYLMTATRSGMLPAGGGLWR